MAENSAMVSVGAMWKKTSAKGMEYLGVSINMPELLKSLGYECPDGLEKVNLSAFVNTKKAEEKQPDYRLMYFIK